MQLHPMPHQQRVFHQQVDVVSGMSPCQLELHDHPFQLRCMHRSEVGLSCTHANRVQELQELTHHEFNMTGFISDTIKDVTL